MADTTSEKSGKVVSVRRRYEALAQQLSSGSQGIPREVANSVANLAFQMTTDPVLTDRLRAIVREDRNFIQSQNHTEQWELVEAEPALDSTAFSNVMVSVDSCEDSPSSEEQEELAEFRQLFSHRFDRVLSCEGEMGSLQNIEPPKTLDNIDVEAISLDALGDNKPENEDTLAGGVFAAASTVAVLWRSIAGAFLLSPDDDVGEADRNEHHNVNPSSRSSEASQPSCAQADLVSSSKTFVEMAATELRSQRNTREERLLGAFEDEATVSVVVDERFIMAAAMLLNAAVILCLMQSQNSRVAFRKVLGVSIATVKRAFFASGA